MTTYKTPRVIGDHMEKEELASEILSYVEKLVAEKIKKIEDENTASLKELVNFKNNESFLDIIDKLVERRKNELKLELTKEINKFKKELIDHIERDLENFYRNNNLTTSINRIINEELVNDIAKFNDQHRKILNKIFDNQLATFDIKISKEVLKNASDFSCVQLSTISNAIRKIESKEKKLALEMNREVLKLQ